MEEPIDVGAIDYAPPWFRARALGVIVLVERRPAQAISVKFKALGGINDLKARAHGRGLIGISF